ncbi:MAG: SDR family oxidoreductase [Ferrovum sp.]|nr:SDR family oxidoreductase [Ferrovum sp.]
MTSSLSRIVIVTGATSGIGEATARTLIAQGYGGLGSGRNAAKLQELERQWGPHFHGVAGDITEEAIQAQLFHAAQAYFGQPANAVVVNAGRGLGGSVTEVDLSRFEEVLKLNVTATLSLMQKSAHHLRPLVDYPRRGGDIVVIGSVVGRHISPFSAVYGSTKFAVHALVEGLRREVGPQGIRVSLVEPGLVLSGFQKGAGYSEGMVDKFKDNFGPLLLGEDIAEAIHFILSRPPHVHVGDLLIRPTRQDYP